jgi:hypothetical protein
MPPYPPPQPAGETTPNGEAIYFAVSNGNDPTSWTTLNGGEPVISSDRGTRGLRDPFITRSADGERFYLLATDLMIFGGGNFGDAQETGSRSLMIWESDNLIDWSAQREVVVAPANAGNVWAPEAYFDDASGEYLVYWASALYPEGMPGDERDIAESCNCHDAWLVPAGAAAMILTAPRSFTEAIAPSIFAPVPTPWPTMTTVRPRTSNSGRTARIFAWWRWS